MWKLFLLLLVCLLPTCKKNIPVIKESLKDRHKEAEAISTLSTETSIRLFNLERLELTMISEQVFLPLLLLGDPGKSSQMPPAEDRAHCIVSGNFLQIPLVDSFHKVMNGKRHGASLEFTWEETLQGSAQLKLPATTPGTLACAPMWGVTPTTSLEKTASFIRSQNIKTQKGTEESYLQTSRLEGIYQQIGSSETFTIKIDGQETHVLQRNKTTEPFSSTLSTPTPFSVTSISDAYTIETGVLLQTTDHKESVSIQFSQVHYSSLYACQPDAGQITGQFVDDQQQIRAFSIAFAGENAGVLSFANGETATLELPFHCR